MSEILDVLPETKKRDEHLSKDGKRRSFPMVPNLLQYVSSGGYLAEKVNGKLIREGRAERGATRPGSIQLWLQS